MAPDSRPEIYRKVAEHLRSTAANFLNLGVRIEMETLARQYDQLAEIIDQYEKNGSAGSQISD